MERTVWTERRFSFDAPAGWMPNVVERLRGTIPRLVEMTNTLDDHKLSRQPPNAWSIKEHIGHLIDLELLHTGRIDDFLAKAPNLRAADMSNKRTYAANHNTKDLQKLLDEFRDLRTNFIERVLSLSDECQNSRAMHPRLQVLMRPIDVVIFAAEHDDHHLASIRTLIP